MASKRRPISFPELEPRGKGAILRTPEEIQAEQEAGEQETLENQYSGNQENQHTGIREDQKPGREADRATYTKVTYRLSPEAVDAINEAKHILRRTYRMKVNLEEIAEAAILEAVRDLQEKEHASFLVTKFSGNPENK
jgi:hypothetical protein